MGYQKKCYRSTDQKTNRHQKRGGDSPKATVTDSSHTGKTPKKYHVQAKAHWGAGLDEAMSAVSESIKRRVA